MNNQEFSRPQLIRADNNLRNKWLAAVTILILFPAFLLWNLPYAQENLLQLISEDDSKTVTRLLVIFYSLLSIMGIMLMTAGIHMIKAAVKVRKSGRYPAPKMRVVRDTFLVSGTHAIFISYLLMGTGFLLLIGGGSVPYYFHNLLLELLVTAA